MEEPDVSIRVAIQALVKFKVLKEQLPLCTEATCQIAPQPFNADVVNTPGSKALLTAHRSIQDMLLTDPIYMNHVKCP